MSGVVSQVQRGGEFGLIDWIRQRAGSHPAVVLGIGDDCAVMEPGPGRQLLVTTDMLLDGRHFRLEQDGAEAVGYKALGVNLSDIAAMAGRPLAAFVSVALPVGHAQIDRQGTPERNGAAGFAVWRGARWGRYQRLGWATGDIGDRGG